GPGAALALPGGAPAPVPAPSEGAVVTSSEGAHPTGLAALGAAVPPQGVPVEPGSERRARHSGPGQRALPALPSGPSAPPGPSSPSGPSGPEGGAPVAHATPAAPVAQAPAPAPAVAGPVPVPAQPQPQQPSQQQPAGRRARRALAPAQDRRVPPPAEADSARSAFALPPAEADRRVPAPAAAQDTSLPGRHDAVRTAPDDDHTPPQPHPLPAAGRRAQPGPIPAPAPVPAAETAAAPDPNGWGSPVPAAPVGTFPRQGAGRPAGTATNGQGMPTTSGFGFMAPPPGWPEEPAPADAPAAPAAPAPAPVAGPVPAPVPAPAPVPEPEPAPAPAAASVAASEPSAESSVPHPRLGAHQPLPPAQPLPQEAPVPVPVPPDSTQGRAFSVRTLGQGVPLAQQGQQIPQQIPQQGQPATAPSGPSGRRRKLGTPPAGTERPEPAGAAASLQPQPQPQPPGQAQGQHQTQGGGLRLPTAPAMGRSYAIGAPDEGAEGPEPLDGPGGAVEVANRPQPQPVDDELPPEPLDNPRRLLVWPAPDVLTQQALSDRGYRPVVVHSREEVAAQIAAFPAALFVDPLTGPITRTALQSLRQAAVAAEVPVLVTAGLGQATREAAYGADPAVLLKALAPRDSEQHPSRVLVIEEHEEIALALTETLERRGLQVARAANDNDAVNLAAQIRPNLVVMDLMQVRRRRAGIIDWLRANGQLNRTPLVIYTSAGINEAELPLLSSGETVLFLAERSTSTEVQDRIVDLLAKIGN
ncbi:hypothetical protein ACFWH2_27415, partial [Streptomyces sp. NPDC127033]